jgi:hypothetical protein
MHIKDYHTHSSNESKKQTNIELELLMIVKRNVKKTYNKYKKNTKKQLKADNIKNYNSEI